MLAKTAYSPPTLSLKMRIASNQTGSRPSFSGSGSLNERISFRFFMIGSRTLGDSSSGYLIRAPIASISIIGSESTYTASMLNRFATAIWHSASVFGLVAYSMNLNPPYLAAKVMMYGITGIRSDF